MWLCTWAYFLSLRLSTPSSDSLTSKTTRMIEERAAELREEREERSVDLEEDVKLPEEMLGNHAEPAV